MIIKRIKKTALQIACDRRNIKLIKNLIKVGIDVDERNFCGETALDIVCRNDDTEIIDLLLDAGAKLKLRDYAQLMRYLSSKQELDYKMMSDLFKDVAKDHIIINEMGDTLLHIACRNNDIDVAKMLINGNEVLNIQNRVGDTPLHIACMNNNYNMVQLLLSAGCKLNIANDKCNTPLHIVMCCENYAIVKTLLEKGANFDLKDNCGKSPLEYYVSRKSESLKMLKSNILTLKSLSKNYNFKEIENFIQKNTSNLYKVLAIKFILSSDTNRDNKSLDVNNIINKNRLVRAIANQTNALDALKWAINNDDFKVLNVILRSESVTLYDLTARFGQDMTIIDLAHSVNYHAVDFLETKKLSLEKNARSTNKRIGRVREAAQVIKDDNLLQIPQVSQTKQTTYDKLKSFFGMC